MISKEERGAHFRSMDYQIDGNTGHCSGHRAHKSMNRVLGRNWSMSVTETVNLPWLMFTPKRLNGDNSGKQAMHIYVLEAKEGGEIENFPPI